MAKLPGEHPLHRTKRKWMQGAAREMKAKGTEGKFTEIAKRRGESTQQAASELYDAPGKEGKEARFAYIAGHGHGK